jgi:hypothetical protein
VKANVTLTARWTSARLPKARNLKLKAGKRRLAVSYASVAGAAGYQVQIPATKKYKTKKFSITTTKKLKVTLRKLLKKNLLHKFSELHLFLSHVSVVSQ